MYSYDFLKSMLCLGGSSMLLCISSSFIPSHHYVGDGSFQALAIINKYMWTQARISVGHLHSILSLPYGRYIVSFSHYSQTLFQKSCTNLYSLLQRKRVKILYIVINSWYVVSHFNFSHLGGCIMIYYSAILISLVRTAFG